MSDKENDLGYLSEVTPEDVKGLFFLDFIHNEESGFSRWVREPQCSMRNLAIHLARLDPKQVERLRVQPLTELIQPVNDLGLTEEQCDRRGLEFIPECQKVEWIFGSMYRITKDILDWDYIGKELDKGLYGNPRSGLLIADLSTISSCYTGSEGAIKNPETSYVLLDLSCHRSKIKQGMEILSERCSHITDSLSLTSTLLEHALEEFVLYPDESSVMSELLELDEFMSRYEKSGVA